MLRDSTVVTYRGRARPRAIPLAMITMRKSIHRFLLLSIYGYGAPLGGLRPAELRDKETFVFWARVKGNFKLEQKNFSLCNFLAVQSRSLNSHYLYASVLKLIYLRHNIDCFIASHCLFKVQT